MSGMDMCDPAALSDLLPFSCLLFHLLYLRDLMIVPQRASSSKFILLGDFGSKKI